MVAVVHAETSTGVEHPLAELGAALQRPRHAAHGRLRDVARRRAARGGRAGAWTSPTPARRSAWRRRPGCHRSRCPSARWSGCARAGRRCRSRSTCCCSSATGSSGRRRTTTRRRSWRSTRFTRRSAGCSGEGLEERWERHAEAAAHLQAAIEARGLELLADPEHRLAPLTAVRVPEGVDGKAVQGRMLRDHGIEIGGGLGPDAPAMWRIGLMGRNATVETADACWRRWTRRSWRRPRQRWPARRSAIERSAGVQPPGSCSPSRSPNRSSRPGNRLRAASRARSAR